MRLTNSNWLKTVLLPGALSAMEVCWVYPWVLWLATWAFPQWGHPVMGFLSALGITLLSTLGTRYLLRRNLDLAWVRIAVTTGGFLAVFAAVEAEYASTFGLLGGYTLSSPKGVALALGAYLWWRGINFGRSRPAFEDVNAEFLVGIAGLVGLLLVSLVNRGSADYGVFQSLAGLYVAGFFLVGLLALSLARLEMIREDGRAGGATLGFSRHWLAVVVGVIVFIVLVTFVIAMFFSFDLAQRLAAPLSWAAEGLYYLFYVIFLPLSYLVAILIYVLRYLVAFLRVGADQQPLNRPDFSEMERLRERAVNTGLSPEVVGVVKWLLLAVVVGGVLFFFVRAVFRYRQAQAEDDIEEIHESLWSWQEVMSGLLRLLQRIRDRLLMRRRAPGALTPGTQVDRGPAFETSLAIREVYRRLLAIATQRGAPRLASQTPYEYLPALRDAIPDGTIEADIITQAYVRARYSSVAAVADEVHVVNCAWEKLRGLFAPEKRIG